MIDGKLQLKHASAAKTFDVGRYVGWSCVLNCFMLSSLRVSMLFADLLSLHLVTFLMFVYILYDLNNECIMLKVLLSRCCYWYVLPALLASNMCGHNYRWK